MASTALSDIIKASPLAQYVPAALPDHIELVRSGCAVMDYEAVAAQGGDFVSVPKFVEDTAADEVNDGTTASTPGAITSYKDIAAVLHRKRVRAVDDVIKAALGRNDANAVNDEIGRQNLYYWSKRMQTSAMSVLAGVFDPSTGPLLATHVNTTGVSVGPVVPATFGSLVDTSALLGDNMGDFTCMITPSKVWANLVKENAAKVTVQYIGVPGGQLELKTYNGMLVYVDDTYGTTGSGAYKLYTTFLCRGGCMYFAVQRQMTFGYQYEAAYPRELITSTLDYAVALRGVKWSSATTNPTNSDLSTASNWTKVATNNKEIGMVALRSNAN